MSLVLLLLIVGAVAYRLGRWWAVGIAPAVGLAVGGVIVGSGGSLRDTPLLFAVAIAAIAAAAAVLVRRRAAPAF